MLAFEEDKLVVEFPRGSSHVIPLASLRRVEWLPGAISDCGAAVSSSTTMTAASGCPRPSMAAFLPPRAEAPARGP